MAKTNIAAIAVIILTLNFNITNELTIPNTEANTNKQTRFNKNNILINLNREKYNVENINIDMKKNEDEETENNDSFKLYENKDVSAIVANSNNPDIKIQDANENIFKKTTAKLHKNEEHTVKATLKRKAVKQNRVKRDTDDDIIVWDYCEGKKHLEYIDGRFQCVDMSFDNRNSFGTLVKCPSNTRRVILNAQVVMCKPKRRRV